MNEGSSARGTQPDETGFIYGRTSALRERTGCSRTRSTVLVLLVAAIACGLGSVKSAVAFNCGYSPCIGTGGNAAGFTDTVTAQSVSAAGGTISGSAFGATITVQVPAGALPGGGEVVIGTGVAPSVDAGDQSKVVIAFSVFVIDPATGENLGPFSPALTVTIAKGSIKAGDAIVTISGPSDVMSMPGLSLNGSAVVSLTSNANIAIVRTSPMSPADDGDV